MAGRLLSGKLGMQSETMLLINLVRGNFRAKVFKYSLINEQRVLLKIENKKGHG